MSVVMDWCCWGNLVARLDRPTGQPPPPRRIVGLVAAKPETLLRKKETCRIISPALGKGNSCYDMVWYGMRRWYEVSAAPVFSLYVVCVNEVQTVEDQTHPRQ